MNLANFVYSVARGKWRDVMPDWELVRVSQHLPVIIYALPQRVSVHDPISPIAYHKEQSTPMQHFTYKDDDGREDVWIGYAPEIKTLFWWVKAPEYPPNSLIGVSYIWLLPENPGFYVSLDVVKSRDLATLELVSVCTNSHSEVKCYYRNPITGGSSLMCIGLPDPFLSITPIHLADFNATPEEAPFMVQQALKMGDRIEQVRIAYEAWLEKRKAKE